MGKPIEIDTLKEAKRKVYQTILGQSKEIKKRGMKIIKLIDNLRDDILQKEA